MSTLYERAFEICGWKRNSPKRQVACHAFETLSAKGIFPDAEDISKHLTGDNSQQAMVYTTLAELANVGLVREHRIDSRRRFEAIDPNEKASNRVYLINKARENVVRATSEQAAKVTVPEIGESLVYLYFKDDKEIEKAFK